MLVQAILRRMRTMGMTLAGRTAIVTGAAQGLGLATAEALAAAGARVLLTDVQAEKVQAAAGRLECLGTSADVTRNSDVEAMVRIALSAFGHVDILVNSAGGSGTVGV